MSASRRQPRPGPSLRVAHLTCDDCGGVSSVLASLMTAAKAGAKHEHHVVIAGVDATAGQALSRRLGEGAFEEVPSCTATMLRWLVKNGGRFDVLVAHKVSWYFWAGLYCLWRRRPAYIVVLHDGELFRSRQKLRQRIARRLVARVAEAVVVVRESFVGEVERVVRRHTGTIYIGNPAPPDPRPTAADADISSDSLRIISLSRLDDPRKDVGTILRAVYHLQKQGVVCSLKVGGEGRERAKWEMICDELGVQSVDFVGEVLDVAAFLTSGDCVVLSSTFPEGTEGTPIVLLEAMSVGVPVLASRSAAPEWALAHGLCPVFPDGDWAELALHLQDISRGRTLGEEWLKEMRQRAACYVRDNFDVDAQLARYEEVMTEVVYQPSNQ